MSTKRLLLNLRNSDRVSFLRSATSCVFVAANTHRLRLCESFDERPVNDDGLGWGRKLRFYTHGDVLHKRERPIPRSGRDRRPKLDSSSARGRSPMGSSTTGGRSPAPVRHPVPRARASPSGARGTSCAGPCSRSTRATPGAGCACARAVHVLAILPQRLAPLGATNCRFFRVLFNSDHFAFGRCNLRFAMTA